MEEDDVRIQINFIYYSTNYFMHFTEWKWSSEYIQYFYPIYTNFIFREGNLLKLYFLLQLNN